MIQLNIFETVKQSVGLRQAASFYGLKIRKNSQALCPFHPDRHPSMQLYDDHYYCFACGAHGDVIDLTAGLFDLQPLDAAKKLAADFGIGIRDVYDARLAKSPSAPKVNTCFSSGMRLIPGDPADEDTHLSREEAYAVFCGYRQLLLRLQNQSAPSPGEEISDAYCIGCNELSRIEQFLDILQPGSLYSEEDIQSLLKETETEVTIIHEIIRHC